jgi:hypothetical protein
LHGDHAPSKPSPIANSPHKKTAGPAAFLLHRKAAAEAAL